MLGWRDRLGLGLVVSSMVMPWGIFVLWAMPLEERTFSILLATQVAGIASGTASFVLLVRQDRSTAYLGLVGPAISLLQVFGCSCVWNGIGV